MNNYEAMLVFSVENGEESVQALVEKFTSLIAAHGTVESGDDWSVRDLAYEIDFQKKGHYYLYNFSSNHEFPAELDRIIKITDGVLNSLIIRK